ncbi:(2Fe-2S) ferredoxin domain-containing protein [Clostridium frigidicarnis]|uniref:Thioredoxin-like [2Fe-2S] ferredoxin n=1 Tax=Clostridium frigidicarnis TaxID=84698 RepID=A0A1I0YGM9_9CLOT|nr:(2Fe-2S) ferredoxin domain-containing protein [Clostridium frigidicarnis]SFB12529.1 Thioredoxin-like [2Fe-2S] ferredoxin [Clostridium frigidicarnis]
MKTLKVCIGSSCHLKGSYDVIEEFKKMIEKNNLGDKVELKAAFCLGNCTEAVSVQRWDGKILSVSKDNIDEVFEKYIVSEI